MEAQACTVRTTEGEYCVKVYDKQRSSVQPYIDRMDRYIPILFRLCEDTGMRGWMAAPVLTRSGQYKVEDDRWILVAFPMINGATLKNNRLTEEQIRQLAWALAELHSHGGEISGSAQFIQEDFSLPFADMLKAFLDRRDKESGVQRILRPFESSLRGGPERLGMLAKTLKSSHGNRVLCHTDIHGWNLMWTDKIILVDWEGLRLAPAEADLFVFTEGFFFDYAAGEFMSACQKRRKEYKVNEDALAFYRLRRRMEDISEFIYSVEYDNLTPGKKAAH